MGVSVETSSESGRRERVLAAALATFARYGYKKTSMDDVARAADISRPGLYFLFTSKENLFRTAVTQALDDDIEAARRALDDTGRPLRDRLIEAFDFWTGRYIGAMARDVPVLMETNPELLGAIVNDYPERFTAMVVGAVAADVPAGRSGAAKDTARTMLSLVAGIKHQAESRDDFTARTSVGVDLLLAGLSCTVRHSSTP
jgi:AcrR family transcriptional regulator